MQTVSEAWKSAQLQNFVPESFVEISYGVTDPAAEEDATPSDSGHLSISDISQTMDGITKTFSKYVTLEKNIWELDGAFPLLPTQNAGFVSSVLSGADATFATPPIITVNFTQVHENTIPGIQIVWSTAFDECANTFTVTAYKGESVVATQTVTGNTQNNSVVSMDISGYDKIEISIAEWCLPYHRARIEQITLGVQQIFTKSDLIGYEHSQFVDLLSLELPKTEVVFEINNVEGEWNPDNPQGVFKYLLERQKIKVKYGYMLNGAIEWIAAGTFFMSEWETPQNGITASFTARDLLEFMQDEFVPTAGDFTLYQLCEQALTQSGLPLREDGSVRWELADALYAITVAITTDFKYTCAEVLQLCANAACCVFYQDRQGVLHIETLADTLTDYEINRFNSYANAEYELTKGLKSVSVNDGMGAAANSATGEIQTIQNELIQNATVANAVAEWVKGVLSVKKTLSGDFRADPRLDALDKVTVTNKYASNTVFVTDIKYTYNGVFRGSYEGRVSV